MTSSNSSVSDFNDALNLYYKLKKEYEAPYKKLIESLVADTDTPIEKKREKLSLFKNKCVKCDSLGGTIFKQDENILTAQCGNTHAPCKLNIKLQKGKYMNIVDIIADNNNAIDINKLKMIQTKLNFLFGFNNESATIEEFNKLKAELIVEVQKYQVVYTHYLSIINNLNKKKQLAQQEDDIIIQIEKFKDLINKFDESNEITYLKEATELYINNITKIANTIRDLKYVNNAIDIFYIKNDKIKMVNLIQETYNLEQLHVLVPGTEEKIIDLTY